MRINYIANGNQVSPFHHLYTKWKFIVPFTSLSFEMLTQMSIHAHTESSSSSSHIPQTPLTINKANDMPLAIFVTVLSIWCILNERTRAGCVCIEIKCHTNAKVQNDFNSFYLHCVIQMIHLSIVIEQWSSRKEFEIKINIIIYFAWAGMSSVCAGMEHVNGTTQHANTHAL